MSKRITVTYLPDESPNGSVFRPKVPIWISNKKNHSYLFYALVDSGSDRNLFPARLAEVVGINVQNGVKNNIYGIGGIKIEAFSHKINLHFGKSVKKVNIDFCCEQSMPLLGRNGFFDMFKSVDFREIKKELVFKY